jgi:hypothetical protein
MDLIDKFLADHGITSLPQDQQLIAITLAAARIPWGEGRTIEDVLEIKHVGTCTGKHLVLAACYERLGIPHRTVVCTFKWSAQKIALPDHLKAILDEGEWNHGHNFLQVERDGKWIDVDITWDPALKSAGFRTFPEDWNGVTSSIGLDQIVKRTDGADIGMKKQWLNELSAEVQERRERFLKEFFLWIKTLRGL